MVGTTYPYDNIAYGVFSPHHKYFYLLLLFFWLCSHHVMVPCLAYKEGKAPGEYIKFIPRAPFPREKGKSALLASNSVYMLVYVGVLFFFVWNGIAYKDYAISYMLYSKNKKVCCTLYVFFTMRPYV